MDAEIPLGTTPCAEHIASLIRARGRITFSEFMRLALYSPEQGYYSKPAAPVGWKGDYYTSPEVHPVFGELIGDLLSRMSDMLGGERPFTVVELGAGKGTLCKDILSSVRDRHPALFSRMIYAIEEHNPHRRDELRERLAELGMSESFRLVQVAGGAGLSEPFDGCVLSNEFFDSLPVHRVVVEEGVLREIYVTFDGETFRDETEEVSTPDISRYFERLGIELSEGYTAEVNLEAVNTMGRVGRALHEGFILTIDYGYEANELYGPAQRRGTLMCYRRHQAHENPYVHVGEQDITAHVDFTSLVGAGREVGLTPVLLTTQAKFLIAAGLLHRMAEQDPALSTTQQMRRRLAMKPLIMPGGMGEVFKVLLQSKVGSPVPPSALLPFADQLGDSFPGSPPRGW